MQITKLVLRQERITKNTVRYDVPDSENAFETPAVTQLYVAKSAFKALGKFPEQITITVEAE